MNFAKLKYLSLKYKSQFKCTNPALLKKASLKYNPQKVAEIKMYIEETLVQFSLCSSTSFIMSGPC